MGNNGDTPGNGRGSVNNVLTLCVALLFLTMIVGVIILRFHDPNSVDALFLSTLSGMVMLFVKFLVDHVNQRDLKEDIAKLPCRKEAEMTAGELAKVTQATAEELAKATQKVTDRQTQEIKQAINESQH